MHRELYGTLAEYPTLFAHAHEEPGPLPAALRGRERGVVQAVAVDPASFHFTGTGRNMLIWHRRPNGLTG